MFALAQRKPPVRITSRTNRETGEVMPGRLTYGCVRYVRETRKYHLDPVYRSGALIGGTIEYASKDVTYHATSDRAACPIQKEMFESDKDWSEIETAWGRALDRLYDVGADVALANARKNLINEIKRLNAALSA
jgi:hypothetical protein